MRGEVFRTRPDRPWGPPSLLYNGCRVFIGGKTAGAWLWLPTPSSPESKERVELYLYSLSGLSRILLGWNLPYFRGIHRVILFVTKRNEVAAGSIKPNYAQRCVSYSSNNIITVIKSRKIRQTEHVAEMRNSCTMVYSTADKFTNKSLPTNWGLSCATRRDYQFPYDWKSITSHLRLLHKVGQLLAVLSLRQADTAWRNIRTYSELVLFLMAKFKQHVSDI